jgi:hypothetical protein
LQAIRFPFILRSKGVLSTLIITVRTGCGKRENQSREIKPESNAVAWGVLKTRGVMEKGIMLEEDDAAKAESNGCECNSPTGLKPAPSTS